MFGDFDDDIFDDERTTKVVEEPVALLVREPEWFLSETPSSDEHERWHALKFIADRLYRRREFEAAGHAYVESIEACPSRNLGLLRDCVDGAARSYHKAGPGFATESRKYSEELASMATCEDHYFSHASTDLLMTGGISAIQTLLGSEPQACYLWMKLGEKYIEQGKTLFAACCFLRAAGSSRSSVYESKDRFKEDFSNFSKEMQKRAEKILSQFGNSSAILQGIQKFSSERVDLKKGSDQSFEEFWFPSEGQFPIEGLLQEC